MPVQGPLDQAKQDASNRIAMVAPRSMRRAGRSCEPASCALLPARKRTFALVAPDRYAWLGRGKPVLQAQRAQQLVLFKILHIAFAFGVHGMLGPAQGETTILLILLAGTM